MLADINLLGAFPHLKAPEQRPKHPPANQCQRGASFSNGNVFLARLGERIQLNNVEQEIGDVIGQGGQIEVPLGPEADEVTQLPPQFVFSFATLGHWHDRQ